MIDSAGRVTRLDDRIWQIDLGFTGQDGVIAVYLLAGDDDLTLVDTGPSSTLPALRSGIRACGFDPAAITRVLVTHIHLDHSGAVGVLAREARRLVARVHPLGAPHLIDPSRLVASAGRLYGDRMEELWGEIAPLAAERTHVLADGEQIAVAGHPVTAIFSPGHASHHVAFWDASSGTLFTGDVGGVRMQGTTYVCPPTPPPDLDPDAWGASVARLRALEARRLCPTHFGAFNDVAAHWDQLLPNLDRFQDLARGAGADEAALTGLIHAFSAGALQSDAGALDRLEWASPSYVAAPGLIRLLRKRSELS